MTEKPELTEEQKKIFKDAVVVVSTPCYGGVVTEQYSQSLFNLNIAAIANGVKLGYSTLSNESLVTRARNELVHSFLKSSGTHLMFIDADIGFQPSSVLRMLLADKEIVTGAYPLKIYDWQSVSNKASEGITSAEELQKSAIQYVINVDKPDPEKVGQTKNVSITNGLVEVYDAGTGFMLIKREVLEKMIEAYPEILYYSDRDLTQSIEERTRYAFFDTQIDEDKRYLSEDYTFCRRWQALGGKIYLDVHTVLNHIGTTPYMGKQFIQAAKPVADGQ